MNRISVEPNEMTNSMDKFNKGLDTAEEKISELEEIIKETRLKHTEEKKNLKKIKITLVTCRVRSIVKWEP